MVAANIEKRPTCAIAGCTRRATAGWDDVPICIEHFMLRLRLDAVERRLERGEVS